MYRDYIGILEKKMETTMICRDYVGIMEKTMETTMMYRDYVGIMEKTMETTMMYRDYVGIMEKTMETTMIYRDYIGILEKKMETAIIYRDYLGIIDRVYALCHDDASHVPTDKGGITSSMPRKGCQSRVHIVASSCMMNASLPVPSAHMQLATQLHM